MYGEFSISRQFLRETEFGNEFNISVRDEQWC